MTRLLKAAAALVCAAGLSAFAQGVRYDGRVTTVSSSQPAGSQVPILAMPAAKVTICTSAGCPTLAPIYSNAILTVPLPNPLTADYQGGFGFWAPAGNYFYQVVDTIGNLIGTYPISLGGSGTSTSAGITALTGDVVASGMGSAAATLAVVNTSPGTCGDATHVGQATTDAKGRTISCTPVAIAGGGGGSPPAVAGSVQYANNNASAFSSGGVFNTDVLGGLALAYTNCTGCDLSIPPTSVDTYSALPLATTATISSALVFDQRGNTAGYYGTNPGPTNTNGIQGQQVLHPEGVLFSKPSAPPILGQPQAYQIQIINHTADGFSNGESGNSLFEPPAGYTGVADWAAPRGTIRYINYFGAGIHESDTQINQCLAIGDCQDYKYRYYAGGFVAPSDQGSSSDDIQQATIPDTFGTIATISNPTHLTINGSSTQGQGRYIADYSKGITTTLTSVTNPTPTVPGTAVVSATLPISTAQGHFAAECDVPVQTSGVYTVTCPIVVDRGTFSTTGVFASAASSANLHNLGVQILSASALSGGVQNLTMAIHRSIPAGAFGCQGGTAGWAINLLADVNTNTNGNRQTSGSVVPVFCSLDAHTVEYAYYVASQSWGPLISGSSQAKTTQIFTTGVGGAAIPATLTRTNNVVTGFNTGVVANSDMQGQRYWSISGCSDASFNLNFDSDYMSLNGPDPHNFTYPQTGPNGTATGCVYTPQQTGVQLMPAAELYSVTNPTTGQVDGSLITSYQPNFTVGDSYVIPTHYASNLTGSFLVQELTQPSLASAGQFVLLQNNSALDSSAFTGQIQTVSNQTIGLGGNVNPGTLLVGEGQFLNGVNLDTAPLGSIISAGYASNNCALVNNGAACPFFKQYGVISLESGYTALSFNEGTSTFTQTINGLPIEQQSPAGTNLLGTTAMTTAQFNIAGVGSSQFRPCTIQNNSGTMCYDAVYAAPTITNAGTPGTTGYGYFLGIVNPNGALSLTPYGGTNTGNATLSTTNYNVISCSVVPAGQTATVYTYIQNQTYFGFFQVSSSTCSGPSGSVTDKGVYIALAAPGQANTFRSSGGSLYAGASFMDGNGAFGFLQPQNYGFNSAVMNVAQQISMPTAGTFSFDTTTKGNGQGTINALAVNINGSPACTAATCGGGGGTGSGTVTASPKFQLPYYSATGTAATVTGDPNLSTDGAGNVTATSATYTGSIQGGQIFGVGSGTIPTPTMPYYVGILGPSSGTPNYSIVLPNTPPTSTLAMSCAAPVVLNGQNQSVCTWGTSPPPLQTLTDATTIAWNEGGVAGASAILNLNHAVSSRTLNATGFVSGASANVLLKQDSTGGVTTITLGACNSGTWYIGGSSGFTAATSLALTSTAGAANIASIQFFSTNCYVNLR